ncbi:MAG: cytochrome c3 family protein [Polyangiaceae bacterium]
MTPPLPRWSNTVVRTACALLPLAALGLGVLLILGARSPLYTGEGHSVDQPVEFDHRHHVRDDGIDCRYCHFDAWRSPKAGVPSTSLCMGCHAQIHTDSPQLEPVRRSYFEDEPIRWVRVNALPDFVFFDHSVHVSAGVGCESCHGRVDQMARVRQAKPLTMGFCLDCHRNPAPSIRPASEVTKMGYEPDEAGVSPSLDDVNPPTHCSGCHR